MADGVQKADAEMSQEAIKKDLLDLWTYLKIAFDLDGVHKGEKVTLNVEDESLLINTELGANYRSEKRMLSDRLWKSLLIWREDKLLNDLPLEMPRTPSECHPATGEASVLEIVEKSEKRDKEGVDGEIGEFGDGEIGEFGKGMMVSLLANMATVAEVAKEGKTLPLIVGNEILSDPKTSDYLKRIKDSIKPNPPVSKKTLFEDSEINELPALTKVRMQETKISEMTSVLSKFCTTITKTMEQFSALLLQLNQLIMIQENVLAVSQKECAQQLKTTEKVYELIKILREEWGTQITRFDNVVDKLVTTYNLVDIEDEGEYEVRTANLANLEKVRCYECQGYGHIGAKCPRRGLSGRQCYNCGEFGDHRAAECPNSKKFNQQRGEYRYNNVRSRGRGINQRRGLKRKAEYNGKSENAKRGKYNGPRGKSRNNYKNTNNRCDKGGNKGNNSDQGTQQNGGNSTEKTNNHKGENNKGENKPEEFLKPEGEPKRKRGRPRKIELNPKILKPDNEAETNGESVNDTSCSNLQIDEKLKADALFNAESEQAEIKDNDELYHALLADINLDPINYKEAMLTKDKRLWQKAIEDELNSMNKNEVWELVSRPTITSDGKKANIIDSRWVFKQKIESDGKIKHKARLVIRGFKDKNYYELRETYAPVSRLPLVRSVIAIINKHDLDVCQLDVKTAFLNGTIRNVWCKTRGRWRHGV
ncbi:uncharacterized protein LOC112465496 [Temnothorax curvispinosus]|uniref:Uncharacterized protein LOC112465496 n=1 Tax=Temnothorax curvispinosus TaxID=300111 RepID=A0A6J1R2F9_9HYME|nr:uncharacterized protein LOC112465496 [Temnothorax curvispinosus]